MDWEVTLDMDNDYSYRPLPCTIEAQVGYLHQRSVQKKANLINLIKKTKSMHKQKINQFFADAAEKFYVAQAVIVADLAKPANLKAQ